MLAFLQSVQEHDASRSSDDFYSVHVCRDRQFTLAFDRFYATFGIYCGDRRFFVTRSGRFEVGPMGMERGDLVVAFSLSICSGASVGQIEHGVDRSPHSLTIRRTRCRGHYAPGGDAGCKRKWTVIPAPSVLVSI